MTITVETRLTDEDRKRLKEALDLMIMRQSIDPDHVNLVTLEVGKFGLSEIKLEVIE